MKNQETNLSKVMAIHAELLEENPYCYFELAYTRYTDDQLPTFHEIRALSIFLHKKAGKDAQKIAGHATKAMTTRYASGHEIMWNDVNVGIELPFSNI